MSQGTEIGIGTDGSEDADEMAREPRTEDVPTGTGRHRAPEPADPGPRTDPHGSVARPSYGPGPASGGFPAAPGPMTGGSPHTYGPPSGLFGPGPHGGPQARHPHGPGPYDQPSNPRMPVAYPFGSYTYGSYEDAGYDEDDPRPHGNGAAVTSCVLGLLGLLVSLRPLAVEWNTMVDAWTAVGISVIALVLGIVGARLPARRPAAVVGIAASLLGLLTVAVIPAL